MNTTPLHLVILPVWIYIIESICLFAVNAKATARIDAKHSGITKNDPESVLRRLKLPVLVFSGRYCDISGFPLQLTAIFIHWETTNGKFGF